MTKIESFTIKKEALPDYQFVTTHGAQLDDGEVLLKLDKFSRTANDITYSVIGELIGY